MKAKIHKSLAWLLTLCMVVMLFPVAASAAYSDVHEHWAQAAIEKWSDLGIVQGADGTFRPNDPITRGEMAVIIDRVMQYQTKAQNSFTDLGNAFYTDAVLKANAAGVMNGYGTTVRPTNSITREESVAMLGRALGLTEAGSAKLAFSDGGSISSWAVGYVNAMVNGGLVQGSNGAFNPKNSITRAEVVTILDNAVKTLFTEAKEYTGAISGSAVVNAPGVVLKDMKITGDLIISEGVGNGDVTLNNVNVLGRTIVRGGGANSIHIEGSSQIGDIIIEKTDGGAVRIVTSDGASVDAVFVNDGKDDIILTGSFNSVTVAADVSVKAVDAQIDNVAITSGNAAMDIDKDSKVTDMSVSGTASGSAISVSGSVGTLTADAQITVNNTGTIKTAAVNANGVVIDGNKPATVNVGSTVTEKPTDSSGNAVDGSSSSGSSSGGSGGGSSTVSAITVTGTTAVGQTLTANTTPANATVSYQWMRCDTATGTFTNITGATSKTFTLVNADLDKYIKVVVTGTGSYTGTQTSVATAKVTPAAPSVTNDDALNTVTGMATGMEYKLDAAGYVAYEAVAFGALDFSDNHTLLVRVAAEGINPVSADTTLTFTANPVTPAAPSVTNDDALNTVTGMATGMEYKLDAAGYVAYEAVAFGALDFSGNHTLLVRVAAEGINPVSADTTLTFTTNPVTPAAPSVTNDDALNTVTGMATGMEYKLDAAGYVAYEAVAFGALDFSGNHTLLVRVAAEGINPVSADTTLTFTTNPVTPAAPSVTNDDALNTVTGMATGMEYKLDAAGYVAYEAVAFGALDFSGNHTLLVRVAAEGINPVSADTTLTFTANPVTPAAPSVTNDDALNTVTGMATGMEYKLDAAGYVAYEAVAFGALDFSGNHTLLVRVAAEGINPVSADTTLTFTTNPVTPAAPSVTNDDALNTVTGMATGMEYKLDAAGYVAYEAVAFGALDFSGNHTLLVRVAAEGINPVSADTTLTFTTNPVTTFVVGQMTLNTVVGAGDNISFTGLADGSIVTVYDAVTDGNVLAGSLSAIAGGAATYTLTADLGTTGKDIWVTVTSAPNLESARVAQAAVAE